MQSEQNQTAVNGGFLLSLDFELMWGVHDHSSVDDYGRNIMGARTAIPRLLSLFKENNTACTWATVGLLFAKTRKDMVNYFPSVLPKFENEKLSPYPLIDEIGADETADPYHFGASLIDQIGNMENQEIATHTFGHIPCLEPGLTDDAVKADLQSAVSIMSDAGFNCKSIVFPRNQYSNSTLRILKEVGIPVFRGTESSWMYKSSTGADNKLGKRVARLVDTYIPIAGPQIHDVTPMDESRSLIDVASSRFLRPWNAKLSVLQPLLEKRIKSGMTRAAQENKIYHLWFHPHNFGRNLEANMASLSRILLHQRNLEQSFGWTSRTMASFSKV